MTSNPPSAPSSTAVLTPFQPTRAVEKYDRRRDGGTEVNGPPECVLRGKVICGVNSE
jgi:hypothetical protein